MKKSKDISSISSILDPEKTFQTEKHIIANTFNKFFANLTCDLADSQISKIDENFNKYLLGITKDSFKFKKFTKEDVIFAAKKIDSNSSCGITQIPVIVNKHCIDVIAPTFA